MDPCQTPLAFQSNNDSSASRKERGPTKCRLPIILDDHGQPICDNRSILRNYLGDLARNAYIVPLSHKSWHEVNQEKLFKRVESNFDIEKPAKWWVLHTISSCWRTHKSRVKKKYFKENMPYEYNLKNRPKKIPREQWKILIKFWNSDMAKDQSRKNKNSRAKITSMHTTGSESFVEIRKELEEAIASLLEALEQRYGRRVVSSDLWRTRSQLQMQMLMEVEENVQAKMRLIRQKMQDEMEAKLQKMQDEMEAKLQEQVNMIFNGLQTCFRDGVIPDLSTILIPNMNEGEAVNARSSVGTQQGVAEVKHFSEAAARRKREPTFSDGMEIHEVFSGKQANSFELPRKMIATEENPAELETSQRMYDMQKGADGSLEEMLETLKNAKIDHQNDVMRSELPYFRDISIDWAESDGLIDSYYDACGLIDDIPICESPDELVQFLIARRNEMKGYRGYV